MKKYFTKKDVAAAMTILDFFCVKTDCFGENGQVFPARYLVAIDDDPMSAFQAAYLYHLIYQTHGFHPTVLCVGGKGPLSKFTNENGETEGMKLRRVCISLGVKGSYIVVLDRGTHTGANLKDIVTCAAAPEGLTIFCLTVRLSFRLKQTLLALDKQYPELADDFAKMMAAGVKYYVPEQEDADSQCHAFNGKSLARRLFWFSEVASIYDRYLKYVKEGKMERISEEIPEEVVLAHELLAGKYPLKNGIINFDYAWQFVYGLFSIITNRRIMRLDLEAAIRINEQALLKEFSFLVKTKYGLFGGTMK